MAQEVNTNCALWSCVRSLTLYLGLDKILISPDGEITVTNDGATILKAIQLDNAAAKILVNISKVQDDEVGDGTTSVCVLAAELLREAEKLIAMKIHPRLLKTRRQHPATTKWDRIINWTRRTQAEKLRRSIQIIPVTKENLSLIAIS